MGVPRIVIQKRTVGEDDTDSLLHLLRTFDAEMGCTGRILPFTRHDRIGAEQAQAWYDAGASVTRSPRLTSVAVRSEKQIRTLQRFSVAAQ